MRIPTNMIDKFRSDAAAYLQARGFTPEQVVTGSDAWALAHWTRFASDCYDISRDITDAHIKTALAKVFPNAVFKDKYHY